MLYVSLGLFVFAIVMYFASTRHKRKLKKIMKKTSKTCQATIFAAFHHLAGLPIPEDTICQVYSTPRGIEIVAKGQQFNLAKDKIIDITIKTDTEIQKQVVSSAGGAIGGAMLFGAVGALIGGRPKTKTTRKISNYLILTYQKDATSDYIGFDVSKQKGSAQQFVREFNQSGNKQLFQTDL